MADKLSLVLCDVILDGSCLKRCDLWPVRCRIVATNQAEAQAQTKAERHYERRIKMPEAGRFSEAGFSLTNQLPQSPLWMFDRIGMYIREIR